MKFKFLIIILFLFVVIQGLAQESNMAKFKRLSNAEKCWVIWHPFAAKKALRVTEETRRITNEIMSENSLKGTGNGGQIDAFRHTYWMASLTQVIGWRRSKKLGKAHEKGNYKDYKKCRLEEGVIPDKISSDMDFFNNDVGIKIGKMADIFQLKNIVIEAVKEGRCKVIKMDQKGDFLDIEGGIIKAEELKGKWENDKCLVDSNN